MLIIPHLKTQYLPKLGIILNVGANKLVFVICSGLCDSVPHLTEVRFYGWKVTAYSKAGQRLRFIIFDCQLPNR
jgi:hypothetical protein